MPQPLRTRPIAAIYSCHRVGRPMRWDSLLQAKPVDVYNLGDRWYLEEVFGASDTPFYGRYSDSISAPNGTGCRIQIGAPTAGVLPTGAATVLAAGNGYPAAGPVGSLTACTISAFFIPLTGLVDGQLPATGRLTTTGSRQVASAVVDFGGNGYTATGATEYMVVASCNAMFWLLKGDHQLADPGFAAFYARWLAGEFLHYGIDDDHERISNLTFAASDLTSRNGGSSPWWESQGGQAAMLAFWRTTEEGCNLLFAKHYNNPPKRPNLVDIPYGLQGAPGVSPRDFDIQYHAKDYGLAGQRGGNRLRLVQLDCVRYKHPYDATDDGTGTAGKTMLGYSQVRWALDQARDAKAQGMAVVYLLSKDIGNRSNGDSWRCVTGNAKGYQGELNYMLATIEAENLPVAGWIGGDRHQPHAGLFSTARGNAGNALSLCPCPFGADPAGIDLYDELIWANRDPNVAVYLNVGLLADATWFSIHDADTCAELFYAEVPHGSRVPRMWRGAPDRAAQLAT